MDYFDPIHYFPPMYLRSDDRISGKLLENRDKIGGDGQYITGQFSSSSVAIHHAHQEAFSLHGKDTLWFWRLLNKNRQEWDDDIRVAFNMANTIADIALRIKMMIKMKIRNGVPIEGVTSEDLTRMSKIKFKRIVAALWYDYSHEFQNYEQQ